ncbi:MAG: ADP-ribose diphosphatase [Alphaproteobacteria bacterium]
MSDNGVEIVDKTIVYDGFFRLTRYKIRHRLFGGGMGAVIDREVFERGKAAVVLPYDPVRDEVVLLEQFRVGALVAGRPPWLIEIVAGIIESGESAEDVARREAQEEAGLELGRLERIGEIICSPGGCTETFTIFCGEVSSENAGGLFGLDHEGEDIRAFTLSFEETYERLKSGEIDNAASVIAVQWLALNRESLRRRWQ